MPVEINRELTGRIIFWNRVYRTVLLATVTFGVFMAIIATRQAYVVSRKLDTRTKDIQNQITCISNYFTKPDRASLHIVNIGDCRTSHN